MLPTSLHENSPLPDGREVPQHEVHMDEAMRRQIEEHSFLKDTMGNLTLLT